MNHPDSLTGKVPFRAQENRGSGQAHPARQEEAAEAERRPRQQPAERQLNPSRPVHLHHQGSPGSGKSTLINNTLFPITATALNGATTLEVAPYELVRRPAAPGQGGRHRPEPDRSYPALNPATYTGLFTPIRELFFRRAGGPPRAATVPAASRSNVRAARCEACQGDGLIKVEMHFLPDIYVPCDVCKGKAALQPRDPGDPLTGQEHPRGAGDDHRGKPASSSTPSPPWRASCRR